MLAPRERDLFMVLDRQRGPFLKGYGEIDLNENALSYYRRERSLEDLAVSGRDILENPDLGEATKMKIVEDLPRFLTTGG